MAENNDNQTAGGRTPRSARLPSKTLDDALALARAVEELGAPASTARIAQHLSQSVGGNFRAKIAAANYYGLFTKEGNKHALTDRAVALLDSGSAESAQAGRDAVMGTGFGPIIRRFVSRPVQQNVLEARLQDDYGVPHESAENLSEILVESATSVGLVSDNRFDTAAIESVGEDVLPPKASDAPPKPARHDEGSRRAGNEKPATRNQQGPGARGSTGTGGDPLGVKLVVNIDASNLDVEDLGELLSAITGRPVPAQVEVTSKS